MEDSNEIRLSNPMRVIVPLGSSALVLVMFGVPIALVGLSTTKAVIGEVVLGLCVAWMVFSAWRTPYAMTIDAKGITLGSLKGRRRYEIGQVKRWWFVSATGEIGQSPPGTNGILFVTFADGARFRAEVKEEEAARIAAWLSSKAA